MTLFLNPALTTYMFGQVIEVSGLPENSAIWINIPYAPNAVYYAIKLGLSTTGGTTMVTLPLIGAPLTGYGTNNKNMTTTFSALGIPTECTLKCGGIQSASFLLSNTPLPTVSKIIITTPTTLVSANGDGIAVLNTDTNTVVINGSNLIYNSVLNMNMYIYLGSKQNTTYYWWKVVPTSAGVSDYGFVGSGSDQTITFTFSMKTLGVSSSSENTNYIGGIFPGYGYYFECETLGGSDLGKLGITNIAKNFSCGGLNVIAGSTGSSNYTGAISAATIAATGAITCVGLSAGTGAISGAKITATDAITMSKGFVFGKGNLTNPTFIQTGGFGNGNNTYPANSTFTWGPISWSDMGLVNFGSGNPIVICNNNTSGTTGRLNVSASASATECFFSCYNNGAVLTNVSISISYIAIGNY